MGPYCSYLDNVGMSITFGQHNLHLHSKALLSHLVHIIYPSNLMGTVVSKNLAGAADWLIVCQTVLQERKNSVSALHYAQNFRDIFS